MHTSEWSKLALFAGTMVAVTVVAEGSVISASRAVQATAWTQSPPDLTVGDSTVALGRWQRFVAVDKGTAEVYAGQSSFINDEPGNTYVDFAMYASESHLEGTGDGGSAWSSLSVTFSVDQSYRNRPDIREGRMTIGNLGLWIDRVSPSPGRMFAYDPATPDASFDLTPGTYTLHVVVNNFYPVQMAGTVFIPAPATVGSFAMAVACATRRRRRG